MKNQVEDYTIVTELDVEVVEQPMVLLRISKCTRLSDCEFDRKESKYELFPDVIKAHRSLDSYYKTYELWTNFLGATQDGIVRLVGYIFYVSLNEADIIEFWEVRPITFGISEMKVN